MPSELANENPYAAPVSNDVPASEPEVVSVRSLRIRWCVMVALNVPLPLFFGSTVTAGWGTIGMPIGIAIVAGIGLVFCERNPRAMTSLCLGAIFTALAQFYPLLHMFIGMMAIRACAFFPGGSQGGDLNHVFEGTLATLITGGSLIFLAFIAGFLTNAVFGSGSSAKTRGR